MTFMLFRSAPRCVQAAVTAIGFMLAGLASHALAQVAPEKAPAAVESAVRTSVEAWLKGRFKVDSVLRTPMTGMVEVRIGTDLLYADERGNFAIVEGQMVNLRTGENLTALRIDDITRIDFAKLPRELATRTVRGDGKRALAVFEDPYCSFCRTYRKTLLDLNNVTIYTFFLPILRPESETVSRNAWCAKNRDDAWNDWMLLGKEPPKASPGCDFPVQRIRELASSHGITGTPTTFFADGRRMQGAITRDRLEKMLTEAR